MARGIEFYIVFWILFMFAIVIFRELTGKEKWELIKVVWFGAWTAAVVLAFVVGMVIFF